MMRFRLVLMAAVVLAILCGGTAVAKAYSMSIDNDAKYATSVNVWVSYGFPDSYDDYYRISNSAYFGGSEWQDLYTARVNLPWVLDSTQGTRTVYMQFSASSDGAFPTTVQDSIFLDNQPPSCRVLTHTVYRHHYNRIYFSTYDSATRVLFEIRVGGRYIWSNWYSTGLANGTHSYRWWCNLSRGTYHIKIFARDRAENEQPWRDTWFRVK